MITNCLFIEYSTLLATTVDGQLNLYFTMYFCYLHAGEHCYSTNRSCTKKSWALEFLTPFLIFQVLFQKIVLKYSAVGLHDLLKKGASLQRQLCACHSVHTTVLQLTNFIFNSGG